MSTAAQFVNLEACCREASEEAAPVEVAEEGAEEKEVCEAVKAEKIEAAFAGIAAAAGQEIVAYHSAPAAANDHPPGTSKTATDLRPGNDGLAGTLAIP